MRKGRRPSHPFRLLFGAAIFTDVMGMNWLQDHGLISDNCITMQEVAPVDIDSVLFFAGESGRFGERWIQELRDRLKKDSESR